METNYYCGLYTETYDQAHEHFGGLIYGGDFDNEFLRKDNLSEIATRIAADLRRENVFRRIAENRGREVNK